MNIAIIIYNQKKKNNMGFINRIEGDDLYTQTQFMKDTIINDCQKMLDIAVEEEDYEKAEKLQTIIKNVRATDRF